MQPTSVLAQQPRTKSSGPRIAVLVAAVLLVIAAAGGWYLFGRTVPGRATAVDATLRLAIPWPADGQSAAEVEGLGSLGTQGAQTPVPIASVAKVMTAYVVLTDHPLAAGESGPEITVDAQAQDESTGTDQSSAPVRAGQLLSERELVELMLIPSGNNIARLLSRWDAGSQDTFVTKMNHAAAELGMSRTEYTGASGVEDSTTSTAADQLLLARAVMKNDVFRTIVATQRVKIDGVPGTVTNTNTLLGRSGVIGIKTGSTTAAGGALMWAAEAQTGTGTRLILGVVLHQNSGQSPGEGLDVALNASQKLIDGIQQALQSSTGVR
jgi:D-alanyl-D-alanine carboxypeptidase (penicillin-binding protein 5/6)